MALYDLKNEDDVKLYLQNLFTEYKFMCYHEKRADGCHLLGDFMETIRKDFKGAATTYKHNCDDLKYGHSCLKFGNLSYVGRGCEESLETALQYYKKGCELNHYKACLQGGAMLTIPRKEKENSKTDFIEGLKLLEKGCDGQFGLSCYYVSSIYFTGAKNVAKDLSKAFALTKKACDLGVAHACANLSLMYRNGDGTDRDEKLAAFYKQKATEMNTQKKIDFQQYS